MALIITHSVGRNAINRLEDVIAVKARLIELGFVWLRPDALIDMQTIETLRLFQAIKNGHQIVSRRANDGRIDVDGDTQRWLNAINAPRWQIMPLGSRPEGFQNVELFQTNDNHDYGTNWLADVIRAAGQAYSTDYLIDHPTAALITINDVSLAQGGNSPDHKGHETGLSCDLRLPKLNGESGGIRITSGQYDQSTMRAMLTAFRAQSQTTTIFFNDPDLVSDGLCMVAAGHDGHAHVEIAPPVRQVDMRLTKLM